MSYIHKNLASGRWFEFSFAEQMANVGAEMGRAINWKKRDAEISHAAFLRSMELMDLTIEDPKNRGLKLKELCRLQEVMGDYFVGNNEYGSTEKSWDSYFYFFNAIAAAKYI